MEMLIESDFWEIFNPRNIIEFGGIVLVLSIIYLETGILLGLILPGGDYMLFMAGILCGTNYLDISLFLLIVLLIVASFLGDITGYFKGKWLGPKVFTDNRSFFFKKEYLERANRFYTNYGVWAFILCRFMPVIRTLVPMLAGASQFALRKFWFFDSIGAILWIGTFVPLGFYVGKTYPGVIKYSVYFLLIIVCLASFPFLKIMLSKRRNKKMSNNSSTEK